MLDPAAGKLEFPGGHLEDGEDAFAAAWREWQEETGCKLAPWAGDTPPISWTSANGIYEGFLIEVASEADIPINLRSEGVLNPDDPDGDNIEVAIWVDPADLMGNPMVRDELAEDLPTVLELLNVDVIKAGDADPKASWRDGNATAPVHAFDLKLVDHYAPLIAQALAEAYAPYLHKAITAASSTVTKAAGDALAAAVEQALSGADTADVEAIIAELICDAYLVGAHIGAGQSGGYLTSGAGQIAAGVDWSAWKPGDAQAAALASDDGVSALLTQAGITMAGIDDTTLARLGDAIAAGLDQGLGVDELADQLGDVGFYGDRAVMIAQTESARAVTAATMDTYQQNGVGQYDWILSDGACPICQDNADGGPYDVDGGGPMVPAHPLCRCAIAPRVSSASPTDDESDGDADDESDTPDADGDAPDGDESD